ncbi:hypothetical protein EDD18DRAFT_723341 [Armillaria luteobubalina]|uniref:Uncharacterized protein n=1 Tax=Armillaria luteobubalina TaxID=153913 RepID=A0AA39PHG2_9AGAR|nr:hypothetical protein EDD18DRAFT_723341 [Armillaria luteobubalina]
MTLATMLLGAPLIAYRIAWHAPRMSASHKIIEMLVESCAIYSISLIIYLALVGRNLESANYADIVAAYIKPIALTLLVARVSAHGVGIWQSGIMLICLIKEED